MTLLVFIIMWSRENIWIVWEFLKCDNYALRIYFETKLNYCYWCTDFGLGNIYYNGNRTSFEQKSLETILKMYFLIVANPRWLCKKQRKRTSENDLSQLEIKLLFQVHIPPRVSKTISIINLCDNYFNVISRELSSALHFTRTNQCFAPWCRPIIVEVHLYFLFINLKWLTYAIFLNNEVKICLLHNSSIVCWRRLREQAA